MTIFAVICAGIFPGIHVGRPWLAYWMAPYPNQMAMWPNFRSPLLWDVFAVSTYATVSFLFWYVGMVPLGVVSRPGRGKAEIVTGSLRAGPAPTASGTVTTGLLLLRAGRRWC